LALASQARKWPRLVSLPWLRSTPVFSFSFVLAGIILSPPLPDGALFAGLAQSPTAHISSISRSKVWFLRSFVEASLESVSDDGMPLHNFVAVYRQRPGELPAADSLRKDLEKAGEQLITLRVSPPAADYDGPIL